MMRNKMSYLETIEFLVKEVAKKDQEIKSLSIALDSKAGLSDELIALSDKRLENLVAVKDELEQMTTEKDLWKSEALEYRDKEKQWWAEEEKLKSSIVSINQDRIKVVGGLEDTIKGLHNTVDRFKADYLAEADYVHEKEEEIGAHMRKINTLSSELDLANNRYRNLLDSVKGSDKAYQDKIEALQLEINHLKNNK